MNMFFQILAIIGQVGNSVNLAGLPPKAQGVAALIFGLFSIVAHTFAQAAPPSGMLATFTEPTKGPQ